MVLSIRPPEAGAGEPMATGDPATVFDRRNVLAPAATPRTLFSSVSLIAFSQVLLGVVGIASLPILARNLGPSEYKDFSLFVILLGVVSYQDFARSLLVSALSRNDATEAEVSALARVSLVSIALLALVLGAVLLEPQSAVSLFIAAVFFGLSSRNFAAMSAAGRVASASALRNFSHALAFGGAAVLSLFAVNSWMYTGPFVLAQVALFVVYGRWERRAPAVAVPVGRSWLARVTGLGALRASAEWPRFRRDMLDMWTFNLMASALMAVDRLFLPRFSSDAVAGLYNAHCDLAIKLNILSSAIGGVLLPMLARTSVTTGENAAARRLVRTANWAVPTAFAAVFVLILFHGELVGWILGADFLEGAHRYAWLLCGVFLQFFGFLVTPWQRARGDFTTQRRVYTRTAIATLAVGAILIPRFGADGAVATFLVARLAEVQLLVIESWRLESSILPRWKPILALGLALALFALAAVETLG